MITVVVGGNSNTGKAVAVRVTATFRKIKHNSTVYSRACLYILVKTFAGVVGRTRIEADNKKMNILSPRGIE